MHRESLVSCGGIGQSPSEKRRVFPTLLFLPRRATTLLYLSLLATFLNPSSPWQWVNTASAPASVLDSSQCPQEGKEH